MSTRTTEDPRLVRLTKICLSFPDASREYNGQHATFTVRKKTFAYFLNDHHGDGIVFAVLQGAAGGQHCTRGSAAVAFLSPGVHRV